MFCTNCGKQIDDDSNFCTWCGKEVSTVSPMLEIQEKESNSIETRPQAQESPRIIEKNHEEKPTNTKYDETYEKDTMPTIVGCILVFIWIIVYISNFNKQYQSYEDYQRALKTQDLIMTFNLILRVVVTIWVTNIARFRNRAPWSWGLFAFFLPAFSLILIGQQKKLKPKLKA